MFGNSKNNCDLELPKKKNLYTFILILLLQRDAVYMCMPQWYLWVYVCLLEGSAIRKQIQML